MTDINMQAISALAVIFHTHSVLCAKMSHFVIEIGTLASVF